MANSSIRTELVKHIGNQFEGVIASDITGPNANAPRIDKEMGSEYSKFKVALGLATAIFFYSFSGAAERKGITVQRLRIAFLREGIPFPIVGDAVKRLDDELYFLHSDKSLYYFLSSPNLNRIIIDKEEAIKEEKTRKRSGTEFRRSQAPSLKFRRLLALTAIKGSPDLMKSFSEEDARTLRTKLDDADSAVSVKTIMAYRYVVKGFNSGIKVFDMGIPTIGEKPNLSLRVKSYLKDQELLLTERVSPKVILDKVFEKDETEKPYSDVWEASLRYTHLPILGDEHVLKNGIRAGLGLQLGEKIFFGGQELPSELYESTVLRPEVAKSRLVEIEKGEVTLPEVEPKLRPEEKAMEKPAVIKVVELKLRVPWDKLSDLVRGVLVPLNREGAEITLDLDIQARAEKGISRNTLNLTIKETLNQIGAKVIEERTE